MDQQTIQRFKNLFEEQRQSLLNSQNLVNEDFHLQKDDLLDEMDMASSDLEASMRLRLRNRKALYIKKIDHALHRIHQGVFGICESCEEDIEFRRLEARPTTTLCISCKEEQEHSENLHIDSYKPKSLGNLLKLA